jgi:phospholipid/cholesterol/gamma-HCH transport system ATP-binding protein
MKSIQEKYNTSSIIITHDVDCARVISNRMILLVDGINMPKEHLMNYQLQQIQVQAFFK